MVEIAVYEPKYKDAFKSLNEAWIKKYFEPEEEDIKTLSQPNKIIDNGGFIFVALLDGKAVGVCALRKATEGNYEFSKMAVAEEAQGRGIGKKLCEAAISKAKEINAHRVFLEGNTSLKSSIHLYRKLGFKEISGATAHYKRVNIIMELLLN